MRANGAPTGYATSVVDELRKAFPDLDPLLQSGDAPQRVRAKVASLRNKGLLPPAPEPIIVGDALNSTLFPDGCSGNAVRTWCKKYVEETFVFDAADGGKDAPRFSARADRELAARVYREAIIKKDAHSCLLKLCGQLFHAISQLEGGA